jgi:KaiC/GvpD/RAD55 family RecA-like ATPase
MTTPLRFGIADLDSLITPGSSSSTLPPGDIRWTAAIVGPDGCGKSILALHLASFYQKHILDTVDKAETVVPRVVYVSTDLSYQQALAQWSNFGLDLPEARYNALHAAYDRTIRCADIDKHALELSRLHLSKTPHDALSVFFSSNETNKVHFLDFQAETAGDDWGFINHLLGLLEQPKGRKEMPCHLLIVDAIEGLETFSGRRDAYGLARDRRSRVAQLVRNASHANAHVVFVVEDPRGDVRLPEQFVTDLVIRLRQEWDGTYNQRTLEIEKCRAVAHARGRHELAIRDGRGSFTGTSVHLDDPRIPWKKRVADDPAGHHSTMLQGSELERLTEPGYEWTTNDEHELVCLSHIRAIASLHRWNREFREQRTAITELHGCPHFGLPVLDQIIPSHKQVGKEMESQGALILLLGDPSTHKGSLTRGFLAGAFRKEDPDCNTQDAYDPTQPGVAVLLTTRFLDQHILTGRISQHLVEPGKRGTERDAEAIKINKNINDRVLCQRLSIRHISAAGFLDTLDQYVRIAQFLVWQKYDSSCTMKTTTQDPHGRRKKSRHIRLAIEDWNDIVSMYPMLRSDPLLLQSVITMFKREGIQALIVSTQEGPPGVAATERLHDLRSLNETQILTWPVSFFGEKKVAITVHSSQTSSKTPGICELRSVDNDSERLACTRDFDFYSDVDLGRAQRIPLKVRLYVGSGADVTQNKSEWQWLRLLRDMFSATFRGLGEDEVLQLESFVNYDGLFTSTGISGAVNRDHTLVAQIDEFWSQKQAALVSLNDYWTKDVGSRIEWNKGNDGSGPIAVKVRADAAAEPEVLDNYAPGAHWIDEPRHSSAPKTRGLVLQEIKANQQTEGTCVLRRHDFFIKTQDGGPRQPVDRIPYLWDFGMILADRTLWERHQDLGVPPVDHTVGSIWNKLCFPTGRRNGDNRDALALAGPLYPEETTVSWEEFLSACRLIAERESIVAFDVDELCTEESLSCLLLEIWASLSAELVESWDKVSKRDMTNAKTPSLFDLIDSHRYDLLRALITLVYNCPHFVVENRRLYRKRPQSLAVASRHWYSTACAKMKENVDRRFVPLRLPGKFAVRGDWALAIVQGSRSARLGYRALDIISSRRQNLLRLQEGIGLPVRDVLPDATIAKLTTAMVCRLGEQKPIRLSYGDICDLGHQEHDDKFRWLWRSQIENYDVDSFSWRRWIAWMIEAQDLWFAPKVRTPGTWKCLYPKEDRTFRDACRRHQSESAEDVKKMKSEDQSWGPVFDMFDAFEKQTRIIQTAISSAQIVDRSISVRVQS